jgi:hypothetical protein
MLRRLAAAIVSLLMCGSAPAAMVTFTLSLFDNGTTFTPGVQNFAIYADVSADNGGLYAFGIDLAPGTTYGTVFLNRAPGIVVEDTDDTGERATLGFTQGVNTDRTLGKFSGLQDLGIGGKAIPVYGFGQEDGSLPAQVPGIYENTVGTFGGGTVPYKVHLLLARGNWVGSVTPSFETTSVDNKASVWVNRSGIQSVPATLVLRSPCVVFAGAKLGATCSPPLQFLSVTGTPTGTNQAVGGAIAVSGSNNKYNSEVDDLISDSASGNAPIQSIGDEAGNIYVMAKLNGSAADIATFLQNSSNDADATDSQFALLHAAYDSHFGAGGFNALFKFPNISGTKFVNWELFGSTVTVDKLAVVPEPRISLLVLGSAVMLRRRGAQSMRCW